ncbi:hypothetical protein GCM10010492_14140 [Saccharothrix mutabilis subsp. mutabilis]|uniref:Tetratricopeptide repeat protein n=1 Tax=Saccharothrix mutabilis subsp. mutabilis TaxID=66855 RepID=A0ABP3CXU4_9PSEU
MNRVSHSWINGPNIQVGSAGGNVTIALDRPGYRLHWLAPAAPEAWRPQHLRTPGYLLDARRRTVPFHPRPAVQRRLTDWLGEPGTPLSVQLVHGPGGRGKTRLANAFAGVAHEAGWAVAQATDLRTPHVAGTSSTPDRVLVCVDYADRWGADTLLEMISALPVDFPGATVRVLLLARSPASWPHLAAHLDRVADLPDPVELGDLADDRELAFQVAATAFQHALALEPRPVPTPDLTGHGSALLLHMAALAAVCAARDDEPVPTDLSTYLLRHERRFWPADDRFADAVFLATLLGPAGDAEAVLSRANLDPDLLDRHARLYPEEPFAPLRPDRLGEDFVAAHLAADRRAGKVLAAALEVDPLKSRRALIVLAAAADRHEAVRPLLWDALRHYWHLAGAPVVRTVVSHGSLDLCALLLGRLPLDDPDLLDPCADLAVRTLRLLPDDVSPLVRSVAVSAAANRLRAAGDHAAAVPLAREAVELDRRLVAAHGEDHLATLAGSLANLAVHAAGVDRGEALRAAREAVALWRRIVAADPAQRRHLTIALVGLANREHGPERVARARDAVASARALGESGDPAAEPLTVTALLPLGAATAESGDPAGALRVLREAVGIARRLGLPDLLGQALRALAASQVGGEDRPPGDLDAALAAGREALALFERLAERSPRAFAGYAASAREVLAEVERQASV